MNILDEVKTRLSITGTDLDGTIQGMIDDVISYCRSAGLKYTQLVSTRAVGLIARGVADLWNYGAGNGKFSDIFQLRLNQMTLDAASLDHDVEVQSKSVTITENGTTEITPDEGHVLSSVSVLVNVKAATSEYNILAPSFAYTPYTGLQACITVVDMSNIIGIEGASDLGYLFSGFKRLQTIHWGNKQFKASDVSSMFAKCESLEAVSLPKFTRGISSFSYMFDGCIKIKNIDFTGVMFSSPSSMAAVFSGCKSLESVNLSTLNTRNITSANSAFNGCTSLTNIIFSENLFPNTGFPDLDLSYSPLTHDCAVDIFNKLATRTNSPTIRLSTTTKGYLTEDEIAVATAKGWVVS